MSKFWSPMGSNHLDGTAFRVSEINYHRGHPENSVIEISEWLDGDNVIIVGYPTFMARDADYERLMKALEEE